MTTTISNGTTTLTALAVDGYTTRRDSENVIHNIVGSTDNAVTLRGSGLRKGSLTIVVGASDTLAGQWDTLLRAATTLTFADTARPWLGMKLATLGHSIGLDDETRTTWVISLDYEEVT